MQIKIKKWLIIERKVRSGDSAYCLLYQLWAKVEEIVDEHRGKRKMGKCYGQSIRK